MKNKNNELVITTSEAFDIIRIINKLNMKDSLIKTIENYTKLQQKREQEFRKLQELIIKETGGSEEYLNLSEEEKVLISDKLLSKNNDIQETILDIDSNQNKIGMDILYDFISKIPIAEKEVYKCLAKIFNKPIKEVEIQELDETINMIKEIAKSQTLMLFFKSATR
ncbi:hypothetical protein NE398_16935 [Clostridium tertium]|uniref:Uncharacterized protein n=1 Tax=Clostridium tertium TaxID=1559 RepID=A0A9X4B439_9CLOT|nr:hypothetical protein [Clostridium tertium]MDC4241823.1 hypothetical protein [Clostridium tertium]